LILKTNQRGQVLPLPVVLISTISQAGVRNIAPWSCFMPILRPLDEILIASWIKRDTLFNIRETGDFVINVPPAKMAAAVMICSKNFPPNVDEFEKADLAPLPSKQIKSPGIAGCLAHMECTLLEEIRREKYSLIIGKVVHLETEDKYFEKGAMDFENAQPLSVMTSNTGMQFTRPVYAGKQADHSEMILKKN
jgi:flavin reductase (DIM6/NTAB) family NADH-FMN oxidoreductase RutF